MWPGNLFRILCNSEYAEDDAEIKIVTGPCREPHLSDCITAHGRHACLGHREARPTFLAPTRLAVGLARKPAHSANKLELNLHAAAVGRSRDDKTSA